MAHQGSNPLTAIQIALNGAAAEMIKQEKGASSYRNFMTNSLLLRVSSDARCTSFGG